MSTLENITSDVSSAALCTAQPEKALQLQGTAGLILNQKYAGMQVLFMSAVKAVDLL